MTTHTAVPEIDLTPHTVPVAVPVAARIKTSTRESMARHSMAPAPTAQPPAVATTLWPHTLNAKQQEIARAVDFAKVLLAKAGEAAQNAIIARVVAGRAFLKIQADTSRKSASKKNSMGFEDYLRRAGLKYQTIVNLIQFSVAYDHATPAARTTALTAVSFAAAGKVLGMPGKPRHSNTPRPDAAKPDALPGETLDVARLIGAIQDACRLILEGSLAFGGQQQAEELLDSATLLVARLGRLRDVMSTPATVVATVASESRSA